MKWMRHLGSTSSASPPNTTPGAIAGPSGAPVHVRAIHESRWSASTVKRSPSGDFVELRILVVVLNATGCTDGPGLVRVSPSASRHSSKPIRLTALSFSSGKPSGAKWTCCWGERKTRRASLVTAASTRSSSFRPRTSGHSPRFTPVPAASGIMSTSSSRMTRRLGNRGTPWLLTSTTSEVGARMGASRSPPCCSPWALPTSPSQKRQPLQKKGAVSPPNTRPSMAAGFALLWRPLWNMTMPRGQNSL